MAVSVFWMLLCNYHCYDSVQTTFLRSVFSLNNGLEFRTTNFQNFYLKYSNKEMKILFNIIIILKIYLV